MATNAQAKAYAERIAEHVKLVVKLRAALEEVRSQCAGHSDEFSRNVYRVATEALK